MACKEDMLLDIQRLHFMCVDLNLYLNTHPHEIAAVNDFNYYSEQFKEAVNNYEATYGPLTNFGYSFMDEHASWQNSKWPWQ